MFSAYNEIDSLRPPTPPGALSDSSTGSAERAAISFPVHLYLPNGKRICVLRGDCQTSVGRLVHEVRKWYKAHEHPIAEEQVQLVVGKMTICDMAVKLLDLFDSDDYDDPLIATAVVQHDGRSDVPSGFELRPASSDD